MDDPSRRTELKMKALLLQSSNYFLLQFEFGAIKIICDTLGGREFIRVSLDIFCPVLNKNFPFNIGQKKCHVYLSSSSVHNCIILFIGLTPGKEKTFMILKRHYNHSKISRDLSAILSLLPSSTTSQR